LALVPFAALAQDATDAPDATPTPELASDVAEPAEPEAAVTAEEEEEVAYPPQPEPTVEPTPETPAAPAEPSPFGSLRGQLQGPDGTPVGSSSVWLRAKQGVSGSAVIATNQAGEFRFERLEPGDYELWTEAGMGGERLRVSEHAKVIANETTFANLSLSGLVSVRGVLYFGGEPPPTSRFQAELVPVTEGQGSRLAVSPDPEGKFSALMRPGVYRVAVTTELFGRRVVAHPFEIAAEPAEQELELRVDATPVDVKILLPPWEGFTRGTLVAEYLNEDGTASVTRVLLDSQEYRVPKVVPGIYSLGFVMDGGRMQGQSDPVRITAGGENVIAVELDEPKEMAFAGTFKLPPGRHEYKFFAPPDTWISDPLNPESAGEDVFANSVLRAPGGALAFDGHRSLWPSVDDDAGTAAFSVRMVAPKGDVYVRGTFNNWRLDPEWKLQRAGEAIHRITLKLGPGRFQYKFYLAAEDRWLLDPANSLVDGEGVYLNSIVFVPEPGTGDLVSGRPRIDPEKGEVTFEIALPASVADVYVLGDFCEWAKDEKYKMLREEVPASEDAPLAPEGGESK